MIEVTEPLTNANNDLTIKHLLALATLIASHVTIYFGLRILFMVRINLVRSSSNLPFLP